MARTKGVTVSVKVPINLDVMTERKRQRLRQIVGRDTRAIRIFLGVIEQHEDELLTGSKKNRIHDGTLDRLTMTAIKVNKGCNPRESVPHDLKDRFPRMSRNELTECRQTAVALYESYLALKQKNGWNASHPTRVRSKKRIPRWIFSQRFKIECNSTSISKWWLNLRDSFDSVISKRRVHDRLYVPLKMSPFHVNQIHRGAVKACQIFTDYSGKWWVNFAVRVDITDVPNDSLPPAVLGTDLGIEKAACTTLVTPTKVRETNFFKQKQKVIVLRRYDHMVAGLQQEVSNHANRHQNADAVLNKLRQVRHKRENVSREYDRVLISDLLEYIDELAKQYTLYVAIGRLKNIRNIARKGNYKGNTFRGIIHSWAFARITDSLKHGLAQRGWSVEGKDSRFRVVSEAWTSIMCWKCGAKGVRPKQNYFKCPSCGHRTNADRNGAINIAGRLIMLTKSLHSVRGLGKWETSVQAGEHSRPKTREKVPSHGKSLLSKKESLSGSGESAAVHFVQLDLLTIGDSSKLSDNDSAVEKAVETLSVTRSDSLVTRQENETRSIGGNHPYEN